MKEELIEGEYYWVTEKDGSSGWVIRQWHEFSGSFEAIENDEYISPIPLDKVNRYIHIPEPTEAIK